MSDNFLSPLFPPPKWLFWIPLSLLFLFFSYQTPNTSPLFYFYFHSYSKILRFFVSCQLLKNASVSAKFSVTAKIVDQSTVFTEEGTMLFHKAVIFIMTRVL